MNSIVKNYNSYNTLTFLTLFPPSINILHEENVHHQIKNNTLTNNFDHLQENQIKHPSCPLTLSNPPIKIYTTPELTLPPKLLPPQFNTNKTQYENPK
jgi:hypothetical protein